jgi:hypothetical protein
MTKNPREVNPDLVRQEIEQGRKGDRELAKKPGVTPQKHGGEGQGVVWDDDQRALIENQDADEIDRSGYRDSR